MDNDGLTQYTRIAISLAERIASGQLKEGDKISGRSKLSPEYNVSPETIRRALRLLADMKVVEVKEQSGVYVLSADNARRYLRNFEEKTDMRSKQQQQQQQLKQLLARQELLNHQMAALCRDILDETSQTPDSLPNYSCRVPDHWPDSGVTIGTLRFWQATGATIVAIRRNLSYIVSPELYAGDTVIFVGDAKAREAVSHFFSNA